MHLESLLQHFDGLPVFLLAAADGREIDFKGLQKNFSDFQFTKLAGEFMGGNDFAAQPAVLFSHSQDPAIAYCSLPVIIDCSQLILRPFLGVSVSA